jgi:very-short-patch-repair endonuclease
MRPGLPDECARLLSAQQGVIARWQASAIGLSPALIDTQLRQGRWQPLYRGVYAAYTGPPPRDSVLWAGLLRAGPGAVLSHHTATELDGLTDRPSTATHVTIARSRRVRVCEAESQGSLPCITVHQTRRLDAIRHPARTPPRTRIEETVLDLAELSAGFDDAFSWLSRGCGRRLVTPPVLRGALIVRGRMRWHDEILGALQIIEDGVQSNLEYRYVRDVERPHGLPAAKRQARMAGSSDRRHTRLGSRYLDNLYEAFGVAVELDGSAYHLAEDRWRDIRRDNLNATSGIVTLRFGWTDVSQRPCAVAADVATALRQRGWPGRTARCGPRCMIA